MKAPVVFALLVSTQLLSGHDSPLRWATGLELESGALRAAVDSEGNSYVAGHGLALAKVNQHGRVVWSRNLRNDVESRDVAVDPEGNVLVAGSLYDYNKPAPNYSDIWVFKFSPHGRLLWQRTFDSADHWIDDANGIGSDRHGNVYVSGRSYHPTIRPSATLVLKLSPEGKLRWARSHEANSADVLNTGSMAIDAEGNVAAITGLSVVSYDAHGELRWFWQGAALEIGAFDPSGNFLTGMPLTKISPTGEVLWQTYYTNALRRAVYPIGLGVDRHGNTLLAVDNAVSCTVHNDDVDCETVASMIKYDSSGRLVWASSVPNTSNSDVRGMAVSPNGDSLLTADLASGEGLLARWNADGEITFTGTYRPPGAAGDYVLQYPTTADHRNVVVLSGLPAQGETILLNFRTRYGD